MKCCKYALAENYKKYKYFYIDSNSTIAYKGGHYEKDLLNSLSIPAVNLESFGCPKAEKLLDQIIWLEPAKTSYQHCPKVETGV
jgi:hypothetical protein